MSKKSRRTRRRSKSTRLSTTQLIRPGTETLLSEQQKPTTTQRATTTALPNLAEEYRYVIADLKRIGIIAAVMLVVMIVTAIVLI